MLLNEIKPGIFLTEYIRMYRIVEFRFPASVLLPFKAYPPRPEHCLQLYPRDTEKVEYAEKKLVILNKKAALLGQHTIVNHRHVGRDFFVFQVIFQPGALYKITGIPAHELTNAYLDAEEVFGTGIRLVNEQLCHATNYAGMIKVVEHYLSSLIKAAQKKPDSIDVVTWNMLQQTDRFSVDTFLKEACLSHRQFDRKFLERVGIPPKQYLRVIRFDKAFRIKPLPGKRLANHSHPLWLLRLPAPGAGL